MPRHHPWRHRRREFLGACCANACDYNQCYGQGCYGQTCGNQAGCYVHALGCTIMHQAGDANSTAAGGTLPSTGQPAAADTPPAPTSSFMANLTNFQTPYPYVAIGGVILLAALLTGGGRKSGAAATPNIFHYG